jgi:uncharacterized protein (DUF58 family)
MAVRRIIWGILCIAALVAISTYGGIIAYCFFFFCLGLPLVSLLYLLYVHERFYLYQEIETRNLVSNQPAAYRFTLQNEDVTAYTGIEVKLYEDFSKVDGLEDQRQFLLLPGDHAEFSTKLICRYRGEYDVGVKGLVITDFFGLFRLPYAMPSVIRAIVLPRVVTLPKLRSIPQQTLIREMTQSQEQTQMDPETRDYREGDPLHRIHWKATARLHTLKVRRETGLRKQGIMIFLDTERISDKMSLYLPAENKMLEITIALLHYFLSENMGLTILWEDGKLWIREAANLAQFDAIYRELSAVSFQQGRDAEHILEQYQKMGNWAQAKLLFLVVHQITPSLFLRGEEMAKKGQTVILYVVTEEDISGYCKQSDQRLQIIAVKPEQELEEVL